MLTFSHIFLKSAHFRQSNNLYGTRYNHAKHYCNRTIEFLIESEEEIEHEGFNAVPYTGV